MSAGREFQVDGAATEIALRASLVCMRGTTSIGASESAEPEVVTCACVPNLVQIGCGLSELFPKD